jgi:hypothetical protein
VVERAIAGIEALLDWRSERERVELDPKTGKRTGRKASQVLRVPAYYRAALDKQLKSVLFALRTELGRGKGRAPTLVWPRHYPQTVAVRKRRQTAEAHVPPFETRPAKSGDASVPAGVPREFRRLTREFKVWPTECRPARPRELKSALRARLLCSSISKATAQALADEIIDRLHHRVVKVHTPL